MFVSLWSWYLSTIENCSIYWNRYKLIYGLLFTNNPGSQIPSQPNFVYLSLYLFCLVHSDSVLGFDYRLHSRDKRSTVRTCWIIEFTAKTSGKNRCRGMERFPHVFIQAADWYKFKLFIYLVTVYLNKVLMILMFK